jgi:hypothetical protein
MHETLTGVVECTGTVPAVVEVMSGVEAAPKCDDASFPGRAQKGCPAIRERRQTQDQPYERSAAACAPPTGPNVHAYMSCVDNRMLGWKV